MRNVSIKVFIERQSGIDCDAAREAIDQVDSIMGIDGIHAKITEITERIVRAELKMSLKSDITIRSFLDCLWTQTCRDHTADQVYCLVSPGLRMFNVQSEMRIKLMLGNWAQKQKFQRQYQAPSVFETVMELFGENDLEHLKSQYFINERFAEAFASGELWCGGQAADYLGEKLNISPETVMNMQSARDTWNMLT